MKKWFDTTFWGISIALSWMWGLGLFFSVQFSYQFGLFGLLTFAIPNAIGLILFGVATQAIAKRCADHQSSEALANFFANWSRPFRLTFYLYQLLAITLTIFAIIRYLWQPLNLQPDALYLPLTILIVLAAACLFGEEFNIKRIKYSHAVLALILMEAIVILLWQTFGKSNVIASLDRSIPQIAQEMSHDIRFWSYFVPICIGFLVGPWMDLQQWQRAIQIRRENLSITRAYIIGGILFFLLLLFHGTLALWAVHRGASEYATQSAFDGLTYAHNILTSFFFQSIGVSPWIFTAYVVFICICILTTLDSGYIALRWFLSQNFKTSKNVLFSFIPSRLVTSPIPTFILAGVFTIFAAVVKLELEYFMVFYATFFVGYAALSIAHCFTPRSSNAIPQIKLFAIGSLAVVIFAYGYFLKLPIFLILGSLLPLGYIFWLLFKPDASSEFVTDTEALEAPAAVVHQPPPPLPTESAPTISPHSPSGNFEGKWFVHTFIATYADTNSVGNVYFGMYAMWVGKTRELFFNRVLPKFDLKTSPYYILTRSFQHKFNRETREFEQVSVKIRIANFNRKFVTLQHEIYDSANQLLGKGEQTLMFVAAADYTLIDIPQEIHAAFIAYA